jgi:hypothetical protein
MTLPKNRGIGLGKGSSRWFDCGAVFPITRLPVTGPKRSGGQP